MPMNECKCHEGDFRPCHSESADRLVEIRTLTSKLDSMARDNELSKAALAVEERRTRDLEAEIERLKREAAEWKDAAKKEREYSLGVEKAKADIFLQVESLKDILWKGLACLDLHGGNDKELNAKWVTQAHALGERLEGTEKRINDTSPKARQITPEEFAEGLGAKPMTPEEAAFWQRKHGPGSL